MKCTGIKLICERKDGSITTWQDVFDRPVEEIINKVKYDKQWMGGKFEEILLSFGDGGGFFRVSLDIANSSYNQLLGS